MKRRRLISSFVSVLVCMLVMIAGVYSASTASVVIGGTVSFTAGISQVAVEGNLENAYTTKEGTTLKSKATYSSGVTHDGVQRQAHYYDYNLAQESTLDTWDMGTAYFKETSGDVDDIILTFKITNLSAFVVRATYTTQSPLVENLTETICFSGVENKTNIDIMPDETETLLIVFSVPDYLNNSALNFVGNLSFDRELLETNTVDDTASNWTYTANGNNLTLNTYNGTEEWLAVPSSLVAGGRTYNVTSISASCFASKNFLVSVSVPSSVLTIGESLFYNCSNLKYVEFSATSQISTIGANTFGNCINLKSVILPGTLTNVSSSAFYSNPVLYTIIINDGNGTYKSKDSGGNQVNAIIQNQNTMVVGCKNTIIPSTITNIGASAFSDCYGLRTITLASRVTQIGNNAFKNWNERQTIYIDNVSFDIPADNTLWRTDCNAKIYKKDSLGNYQLCS